MKIACYIILVGILVIQSCGEDESTIVNPGPRTDPESTLSFRMVKDRFENQNVVILGSISIGNGSALNTNISELAQWSFSTAYFTYFDGQELSLELVDSTSIFMRDQNGNLWDVFGKSVFGPNVGSHLDSPVLGMGFWFNYPSKYDEVQVFNGPGYVNHINEEFSPQPDWLIPTNFVIDAAGRDGIPSLDYPLFEIVEPSTKGSDLGIPESNDQVILLTRDKEILAFPLYLLDYHEIANGQIDDLHYAITYCPLAGTVRVFENQKDQDLGVSGLLYHSTLMPFDRKTESIWTQIDGRCVYGPRKGERQKVIPHVQLSWSHVKRVTSLPVRLLSSLTGFDRNYTSYPYSDYRVNQNFFVAPVGKKDVGGIPNKELVFSIMIKDKIKVYRARSFL